MNPQNDEQLRRLLKSVLAPVTDRELKPDLWPRMLRKLDKQTIRVPWFDWALVVVLAVLLLLFPNVIPGVFYQL